MADFLSRLSDFEGTFGAVNVHGRSTKMATAGILLLVLSLFRAPSFCGGGGGVFGSVDITLGLVSAHGMLLATGASGAAMREILVAKDVVAGGAFAVLSTAFVAAQIPEPSRATATTAAFSDIILGTEAAAALAAEAAEAAGWDTGSGGGGGGGDVRADLLASAPFILRHAPALAGIMVKRGWVCREGSLHV